MFCDLQSSVFRYMPQSFPSACGDSFMRTRIVKPGQLTRDELHVWHGMLRANPVLNSPFFLPEFTLAMSAVHSGVRVIVSEQDGQPVAFLPFQPDQKGIAVSVGGSMNDFQGLISEPDSDCSLVELLKLASVSRFKCHKLLDWRNDLGDFVLSRSSSPIVNLARGFQSWKADLQGHGSEQLKQLARKERKLERECGSVRFEFRSMDPDVLQTLIRWKRDQYLRTREVDIFSYDWTGRLLMRLLSSPQDSALQPVLSAMYAGNKLVAAHYGLMSDTVCHWWFPVYDPEYGKYSPGKLLLCRILEESAREGIVRFDFGAGDESYKYSFANDSVDICRTVIDRNAARRWLGSKSYQARMALKASRLGPMFRDVRGRLRGLAKRLRGRNPTEAGSATFKIGMQSAQGSEMEAGTIHVGRQTAETLSLR